MFRWTVSALPSKDRTGEAVAVTVVVVVVDCYIKYNNTIKSANSAIVYS